MQDFKPLLGDDVPFEIGMTVYTRGGRAIDTTGCVVTYECRTTERYDQIWYWELARSNEAAGGIDLRRLLSTKPEPPSDATFEVLQAYQEAYLREQARRAEQIKKEMANG